MPDKLMAFLRAGLGLTVTTLIASWAPTILSSLHHGSEAALLTSFFSIATLFCLSFAIFYTSQGTGLPSFVLAIFYGIVAKPLLHPILENEAVLGTVVGLGATLILFSGGLETPWINFKKLIGKIISLSFIGLGFTAVAFSLGLYGLGQWMGTEIPVLVCVLLGAILASTDPAAIIPVLRNLRFHNRDTKDIVFSESAMTDVTGTLLTVAFIGIVGRGVEFTDVLSGYQSLFTVETGIILEKQVLFGVGMGILGFFLLSALHRFKDRHDEEFEADSAFFLFIPIAIFTIAVALGGSGYLAAFVAGLLFVLTKKLHQTEKFFNQMIEGFLKPTIFVLLGGLVDIASLKEYALIGILASILFMFVIRPIAVFLSFVPFMLSKKRMTWRELLFISFVRETGAIPAVLLVTVVALGWENMEALVPVGMWVILATLIVQPPLTPWVGSMLGVATEMKDAAPLNVESEGSFVVLGSRGNSYIKRLPEVVEWAHKHHINKVILLHCLEEKYSEKGVQDVINASQKEFEKMNTTLVDNGRNTIEFELISRKGFLQDNIESLSHEKDLSAVFVGRKVLDYRAQQIQNLHVPLFFMD